MTDQELAERCYSIPARVERAVHLATIGGAGMDDEVLEWLTDPAFGAAVALAEALADKASSVPGLEEKALAWLNGDDDAFVLAEALEQDDDDARAATLARALDSGSVLGWLVQVVTPRPNNLGPARAVWGSCSVGVFYGERYEDALTEGLEWAAAEAAQPDGT